MDRTLVIGALCVAVAGCADPKTTFGDAAVGGDGTRCKAGETQCDLDAWLTCVDGVWKKEDCAAAKKKCVHKTGCRTCVPDESFCVGQDVYTCSADGSTQTRISSCPKDQQCILGRCLSLCDLPQKGRSNVGCEFWPVDLPNEYYCMSFDQGQTCLVYGCAACQQFAVAVANTNPFDVTVTVEQNDAPRGQPLQLAPVAKKVIATGSLEVFNLPMREVDCTEWAKDGTGKLRRLNDSQTCLSSRAYRLRASAPVVAYQFNPIVNDFSNGASLLIPTNGLDTKYYVLGWSTANPVDFIPIPGKVLEGMPDYTNVTIIGVQAGTKVDVKLAHQTQGSKDGKIPAAKAGDTVSIELGPFDVLNLNSIQDLISFSGDLTGTLVQASKPVVVFSGAARVSVPMSLDFKPKPPEPTGQYSVCCTEHIEQQMFPVSSLGSTFVITRTPIRSTSSIVEPDFYRVLGTKAGKTTTVKTTDPNFPQFTLEAGKWVDFWSTGDFAIEADQPVMVGQYAVAQGFLDNWQAPAGGDPEFVVFPPVEQFRSEYIFLTPPTFDRDYVIIAAPKSAIVKLDKAEVSAEFGSLCPKFPAGKIKGEEYVAIRCAVQDGVHRIDSTKPVGITVYGYYNVGSYGYPGGADIKQINID